MRRLAVVILAVLPGLLVGCAPPVLIASAGLNAFEEGTAAFIRGELSSARHVPMPMVFDAAHTALEELGISIKNAGIRGDEAFILGRDDQDTAVTVRLTAVTPVVTKIRIRIGFFGNQAVSQLIMDRLLARLPAHPVEGPPPPPQTPPPEAAPPRQREGPRPAARAGASCSSTARG